MRELASKPREFHRLVACDVKTVAAGVLATLKPEGGAPGKI
jgi:hypothetical protein